MEHLKAPVAPDAQNSVESILNVLAIATSKISEDVDQAITMRKAGLNTKIAEELERMLTNPIQHLLDFGTKINSEIQEVLQKMVVYYFGEKQSLIETVCVEKDHPLHFYIVLKNDSPDNRSSINDFFDQYYMEDYSDRFPVIFTYTNRERIANIEGLKTLDFDEQVS